MTSTGTIWSFVCACRRQHQHKRPVVSVDFLNDARRERDELAAAIQTHLDTFGYDNHEGLADALAAVETRATP